MSDVTTTTSTTSTTSRPTVAQALAQIAAVREDVATLTGVVTGLAEIVSRSQAHTSAAVAEVVEIAPKRERKASTKASTTKAPRTSKAARTATVHEAAQALPTTTEARALVDAGGDAWAIKVLSATTGKPIPFGLVLRAERAAERKASTGTATTTAKASTTGKRVSKAAQAKADTAKAMFGLGGKELAALAADGDKAAQAEIDRRASKRAGK